MTRRSERRHLGSRLLRVTAPAPVTEPSEPPAPAAFRPATPDDHWVDLLHAEPLVPVETEALRRALRFAFESGDAGGLLGLAHEQAPLAPSTWDPESFVTGLFLPELVDECFPVIIEGARHRASKSFLLRVLGQPPADHRDVALRQEVLRELAASPTMRAGVSAAYVALRRLRGLLDESTGFRDETLRRKVEILECVRGFVEATCEACQGASSALARLHAATTATRESEAYQRLLQVLDFERNLATVDVRVTLGSDGRIRDFALMKVEENRANPMIRPAWRRALERFVAWVRGHRYHEHEVILRVIDDVFDALEDHLLPLFSLAGHLEVYLAALGFRDRAAREGLEVCLPTLAPTPCLDDPAGPLSMKALFNPLLFLQGIRPVPCDLALRGHDALVLVTGPNSGGKTRLLQAVGLTQVLGQAGLYVPAAEATLTQAPAMFVSLIETGRADESEGRLGTELRRVRALFEALRPGSIAILDELCSGTNPSEGMAIFEMVVSLLPRLRPQVFLTTHFLDAARRLDAERVIDRLEPLQVELDAQAEPTYRFVPGVAPTSLAHQVASRLGVTHEELAGLVERQELRARRREPRGDEAAALSSDAP
ncbi:MAG: DNA mismatch repair protein [Myxococcales bacterium]|nr:DNA mismatch repair protein [Myxococcales bacterium]